MLSKLALRLLWREKGSALFRILAIGLWVAIFSVTIVTCLTSALRSVLQNETSELLGADLIIEAPYALPEIFFQKAKQQNLESTRLVEFFSMVILGEKMNLANIIATDKTFPLRGKLEITVDNVQSKSTHGPPPQREIWVDEALINILKLRLHDKVNIGNTLFSVSGIIHNRPIATTVRGTLAPTVYINSADLKDMGVLQPGSQAQYRLLLSGSVKEIETYQKELKPYAASDIKWITPKAGREGISKIYLQAESYLSVSLFIQLLLSAIVISLCAYQYSKEQQNQIAIWQYLGATNNKIFLIYFSFLMVFLFLISITSIGAAYMMIWVLSHYAATWGLHHALWGWEGVLWGSVTGCILLFGFILPSILPIRYHPYKVYLKNSVYIVAVLSLILLWNEVIQQSAVIIRLGSYLVGILFLASMIGIALGHLLVPLSQKGALVWRLGMTTLLRHKKQALLQYVIFTFILTLLLLVQILQEGFIDTWQTQLPANTPNYFLINIQPSNVKDVESWLKNKGVMDAQFYPIVRAKLLAINDIPLKDNNIQRPINLTWMKTLPPDNIIVSGESWQTARFGQPMVSVEKEFANREGIQLGDTLHFQVAEQTMTSKVVSMRTVEWDSFKPNFFVIFPPGNIEQFPYSYITSFYLPPSQNKILSELIKEFVEVSIIDIHIMISNVKKLTDKLAMMLTALLFLLLTLGLLIMYVNMRATLKERLQESAMLKLLGADQRFITKMLLVENMALGFLASSLSSIFAVVIAKYLEQTLFTVYYSFNTKWIIYGSVGGTVCIVIFGLFISHKIFTVSPLRLLQD